METDIVDGYQETDVFIMSKIRWTCLEIKSDVNYENNN